MNDLVNGCVLQHGRYTIVKTLGQGSFGITYLATTTMTIEGKLGKIDTTVNVAIKEFFMSEMNSRANNGSSIEGSSGSLFSNYRQKFRKEAENLSHLNHPNIVKVLEVFDENNTTYYVMQYIDGESLDAYIVRNNGIPEQKAVSVISEIGRAVQYMHFNKMLHLDLKPKNIMLDKSGKSYLIDFGLSKQYTETGEPESSTNVGAGTPGYAPIEQANYREGKGFPVTMDVYALGGTMFKMLTGVRPPEASDILNDGFPLYELQEHKVSDRISASIAKAMAPTKKERYSSVKEFIDSFEDETTVIDGEVVQNRNLQKKYKTEKTFIVRPTTSTVTFEFHPQTPCFHGAYYCAVNKEIGVTTNITQESRHIGRKLSDHEYRKFLKDLQSLNLTIKETETPGYGRLEYSESPAKLTITLYDADGKIYNKLWVSGWKNELGNIEGDIYKLDEQIRKIVPMLQDYIDGPYYEIPQLLKVKKTNERKETEDATSVKRTDQNKEIQIAYRWGYAIITLIAEVVLALIMLSQSREGLDSDGRLLARAYSYGSLLAIAYLFSVRKTVKVKTWRLIIIISTIACLANTLLLPIWNGSLTGAYFILSLGLSLISSFTILIKKNYDRASPNR